MFLKQTAFKPRSGSGSQGSDSAVDTSQPAANVSTAAARRRSSTSQQFAGLTNHKRDSSDASAANKRTSLAEQKPDTGILGGMWQSFTKGS